MRRGCFDKVGVFDENLLAFEDYDLWLRISKYYHFKYIDEPLIRAFLREDSITLNAKCICNGDGTYHIKILGRLRKASKRLSGNIVFGQVIILFSGASFRSKRNRVQND